MRDVTAYSTSVRGHRLVSSAKGGQTRGEELEEAPMHSEYHTMLPTRHSPTWPPVNFEMTLQSGY